MAKKAQARRQGNKGTPAWAWLLAGLLLGTLAYFGYLQYKLLSAPAPSSDVPVPQSQKSTDNNAEAEPEPPASGNDDGVLDTDYSFYDVLPSQETLDVTAPETADPAASTTAEPNTTEPDPQTTKLAAAPEKKPEDVRYLLQAGAFERNADADDLKARIAMSGETARVESAEVNGKIRYRVRLGPYDAAAAEAAKTKLAEMGISANRIKTK